MAPHKGRFFQKRAMTRGPTLWPAEITHQASPARRVARAAPASVTPGTPLVATQLPPVRWPQATGLALWCLGLVRARSGGRTAGSGFGASRPQRQENTVRQQLREWCYAAPAKRGPSARRWRWRPVGPPCCAGSDSGGRAPTWPWRSMPPPWAIGLPCWRSACATGAAPSRWPGPSCPPPSPGAGNPRRRRLQHLLATEPATMTVIGVAAR